MIKRNKMRTILFITYTFILFNSCQYDYKLCDCNSKDEQMKVYNDILNELVEHHFYNLYLGRDQEKIIKEQAARNPDTSKIKKEVIQLQNKLFNDASKFCVIYL